jgi:hypothetical protein
MKFYENTADMSSREADFLGCPEVMPIHDVPVEQVVESKRRQEKELSAMSYGPLALLTGAQLAARSISAAWQRHRAEKLQAQLRTYKRQRGIS